MKHVFNIEIINTWAENVCLALVPLTMIKKLLDK